MGKAPRSRPAAIGSGTFWKRRLGCTAAGLGLLLRLGTAEAQPAASASTAVQEPLVTLPAPPTVSVEATQPAATPEKVVPAPEPVRAKPSAQELEQQRFSTRVRADARPQVEAFSLEGEPMRTAPGTLGDPFRVVSLLPGVASPVPGLPIYAVRGASPGTSGFFLDGMRLPQLFHLLVGGGVVHSSLIEQVDFLPSGYDASIGRAAGGAVVAKTRAARDDGNHLDLALRLYDVSGLLELALPKQVRITVSGHYGYPGPILKAVDDRISLAYWDYQLRLDWRGLTVQALGAYDALEVKNNQGSDYVSPQNSRLMFHRLQVRERATLGKVSLEAAIYGGVDEAGDVSGRGVRKLALGARANLKIKLSRLRLSAGADFEAATFSAQRFDLGLRNLAFVRDAEGPARTSGKNPDMTPDELGELGRPRDGVTTSAYVQGSLDLVPKRAVLTAGGRLDVYHAGGVTLIGLDPRVQLELSLLPWLHMQLGGGIYQQPPTFPILLPGIDTFALQLGLQRAQGGALTEEIKLPQSVSLSATGFYQQFRNFTDLPPLGARVCAPPPPTSLSGTTATLMRTTDGQAYGLELLLRRKEGRVTGWVAYTLSRSERAYPCGLRPADYDQTHILNVVLQARLPRGFSVGARLYVATGRPETLLTAEDLARTVGAGAGSVDQSDILGVRNNYRLPTFVQLDLRMDKHWQFQRFYLAAFVEVVNATFARTNLYLSYPDDGAGNVSLASKPELIGFSWILPSLGLRGGF